MLWKDLVADIERRVVAEDPDTLFDAKTVFQSGIAAGALTDIFNESLLDQSSASKRLVFGNNGAVTLHKSAKSSINIMFFKGHLEHLYYEPLHNMTVLTNDCRVDATRYQISNGAEGSTIDRDSTLVEVERQRLCRGALWAVNGHSEVSDLNSVDEQHPLLATSDRHQARRPVLDLRPRQTEEPWYTTSIDYEVTSMQAPSRICWDACATGERWSRSAGSMRRAPITTQGGRPSRASAGSTRPWASNSSRSRCAIPTRNSARPPSVPSPAMG